MARPPRYDVTLLLDAAVRLAAAAGPAAVTMTAVAKEVGAPSGSVYHRFLSRSALLGALWLRTVEDFQEGWLATLAEGGEPHRTARDATRHVVTWSRTHPREAAVLLHGPDAFGQSEWPAEYRQRAEEGHQRVRSAVARLCAELGATEDAAVDRVTLAVIDLPLTVVRRALRAGQPLPDHAEQLAVRSTALLLSDL